MIEELEGHLGCFGELWGQFCAVVASIRADMIIHDLVLSRQISFWGLFWKPRSRHVVARKEGTNLSTAVLLLADCGEQRCQDGGANS